MPSIVDADLFHQSQAIHVDNSRFSPRHLKSGHYLLRGLVRCRVCDLSMSCHRMRGRDGTFHHYYYCAGHDILRARTATGPCSQRNLRADELDALVWAEVRRHLEHPSLILDAYPTLQHESTSRPPDQRVDDVRSIQKKLADLEREAQRLLDAYQAGLIPLDQLRRRQGLLDQRRGHVASSLEALQHEEVIAQEQARLRLTLESFTRSVCQALGLLSFEQRQHLLRTVVSHVMVEAGRIDIHFAIPLPNPPEGERDEAHGKVSTLSRLRSHDSDGQRVLSLPPQQPHGQSPHQVTRAESPPTAGGPRRHQLTTE